MQLGRMNTKVYTLCTIFILKMFDVLNANPLHSEEQSLNVELIKELIDRVKVVEVNDLVKSKTISELETTVGEQAEELRIVKQRLNEKDQQIENITKCHRDEDKVAKVVNDFETNETGDKMTSVHRHRRAQSNQSTVIFSAGVTHSIIHEPIGQNVVFDQVEINEGNGYDHAFGTFTSPIKGVYLFFASILADIDGEVWLRIVVNGATKASIYARGSDNKHDQGSQMIIVHLNAGDEVAIQHRHPENAIYSSGSIWSTFSGYILT